MLHMVEVVSFCGDVMLARSNMLRWLSARGSQPVIFQQAAGDRTAFRLGFSSETDALAFVCAFGGRLGRSEPAASAA